MPISPTLTLGDNEAEIIERTLREILRSMLAEGRRVRDRRVDPKEVFVNILRATGISFSPISDGSPGVEFRYFATSSGNRLVGIRMKGWFNDVELDIVEEIPREERNEML